VEQSFINIIDQWDWNQTQESILSKSQSDVLHALHKNRVDLEDFKALISPAAEVFIELMAQKSVEITRRRFGNTIQMYSPMYLSNECQNICTYCGFSMDNKLPRKTLSTLEIMAEIEVIKEFGYDHILLVTGESRQVSMAYFEKVLPLVRKYFNHISMEVQPLKEEEYRRLYELGVNTILVYQETYHRQKYKTYHLKGKKANYNFRLETPERIGKTGMYKIGLGVLFGLADWRTDSFFCALHLSYLEKKYWQTKYSISFPRLRPFSGGVCPEYDFSDKNLVQLICAYRLFNEELELSLSTREPAWMRNHLVKLGITSISAGSKTNPGGYANPDESLEQFEISDERHPREIASMLKDQGLEAVWKDWDTSLI